MASDINAFHKQVQLMSFYRTLAPITKREKRGVNRWVKAQYTLHVSRSELTVPSASRKQKFLLQSFFRSNMSPRN